MGLYDEMIFQKPILCPRGHQNHSVQTKQLESTISTYRQYDHVSCGIITGVLREALFCHECHKGNAGQVEKFVFAVLWRNIYLGTYESQSEAEEVLRNGLSVNDCIHIIRERQNEYQRERQEWHRRARACVAYCLERESPGKRSRRLAVRSREAVEKEYDIMPEMTMGEAVEKIIESKGGEGDGE